MRPDPGSAVEIVMLFKSCVEPELHLRQTDQSCVMKHHRFSSVTRYKVVGKATLWSPLTQIDVVQIEIHLFGAAFRHPMQNLADFWVTHLRHGSIDLCVLVRDDLGTDFDQGAPDPRTRSQTLGAQWRFLPHVLQEP